LEIRNFKPRDYWRVTASFADRAGNYEGVYQRPNFKRAEGDEHDRIDRIWEKALADAVVCGCQGQPLASVTRRRKAARSRAAPLRSHHTATRGEQPLRPARAPHAAIAQALYERHKMITSRAPIPGAAGGLYPDLP